MKRQQLIKLLLSNFHLDTVERAEFAENPIQLIEVIGVVKEILQYKRFLPESASIWTDGNPVFEGYFIEKTCDNCFKLHWQRQQINNPFQLAEKDEQFYDSLEAVVDDFIKKEFNYSIDGMMIIK